jgi:hypothetical protein
MAILRPKGVTFAPNGSVMKATPSFLSSAAADFRLARFQSVAKSLVVVSLLVWGSALARSRPQPAPSSKSSAISAAEFSRLIQELSEPGGDFPSDNLTSNEQLYLHITGKLRELKVTGGAYIGVGPEQNFSYIAAIRPQIAFIVDIRRQAMIQHLMYKALFHLASNRTEFLSWLFSAPPSGNRSEPDLPIGKLLQYFRDTPGTEQQMLRNLAVIRKTIEENFQFPLSPDDLRELQEIYRAFWRDNLTIGFRPGHNLNPPGTWGFPSLADLILATDERGKQGNFLAHEADYQFVRRLQEQNRVIPVAGDFAGPHALAAIASYLRSHGYRVSAFYTSNVEEYLYEYGVFSAFAENVCRLPVTNRSVILRAVRSKWQPHSFYAPDQRITPFLQNIPVFCGDFQRGRFPDYYSLVTTDFISGKEPPDGASALPSPAPPTAPQ